MSDKNDNLSKEDVEFTTAMTLTGSVSKAAEASGISRRTAYRKLERDEIRELLEVQSHRMIKLTEKAVDNIETLVQNMDTVVYKDVFDKEGHKTGTRQELKYDPKITYAATKDVLTSPGLLAGGQTSVQIGKLTVNNNTQIISPVVLEALKRASIRELVDESGTIDAECETVVDRDE